MVLSDAIGSSAEPKGYARRAPATAMQGYRGLLLQPDSSPTSIFQSEPEVMEIYAHPVMVEAKCINIDAAQAANRKSHLGSKQWKALTALHCTLLHGHHDFLMATKHPSATEPFRCRATKYRMPARVWKHGIHAFLDCMLAFIYLASQMMALLFETEPSFTDLWTEILEELAWYRMAIKEEMEASVTRVGVAAHWLYTVPRDRQHAIGRLSHHLSVLERPRLRKTLTCLIPFPNARTGLSALCDPVLRPSLGLWVVRRQFDPYPHCFDGQSEDDGRDIETPGGAKGRAEELPLLWQILMPSIMLSARRMRNSMSAARKGIYTALLMHGVPFAHGTPPRIPAPNNDSPSAEYIDEALITESSTLQPYLQALVAMIIVLTIGNVVRIARQQVTAHPAWSPNLAVCLSLVTWVVNYTEPNDTSLRNVLAAACLAAFSHYVAKECMIIPSSRVLIWAPQLVGLIASLAIAALAAVFEEHKPSFSDMVLRALPTTAVFTTLTAYVLAPVLAKRVKFNVDEGRHALAGTEAGPLSCSCEDGLRVKRLPKHQVKDTGVRQGTWASLKKSFTGSSACGHSRQHNGDVHDQRNMTYNLFYALYGDHATSPNTDLRPPWKDWFQ